MNPEREHEHEHELRSEHAEARTMRSQKGMSLVEATIILMVLASLTAVVAPAVGTYREDARQTVAKQEAEAIGAAILQLLNDTGSRCLRLLGTTDCTVTNRVDLLVTSGDSPRTIDLGVSAAPDITLTDPESATNAVVNWLPDGSAPTQQDLLEDQLIENDNATPYAAVSFTNGGGPRMKTGWRGTYLNGPITADPWNARYQVNTIFLTVATNALDTTGGGNQFQEGIYQGGWNRDVLVLSAGSNGSVQTSFGGLSAATGAIAGGDDVVYVMRGSSR